MRKFMLEHFPTIKPSSAKRYAVSLKALGRSFDGLMLHQITTATLMDFETVRRSEGASAPTIRRDLACLSAMLSYCEEWEWIDDGKNIVPAYLRRRRRRGLKEAPPRTRYLSEDEEALLLAHCNEQARTAIILSIDTGLRDQEVFSLQWGQVDMARGVIHTTMDTKSGRARTVPLPARSARLLAQLPRHIKYPWVFCHGDGQRYLRMDKSFRGAVRRSGLKDLRWHDLRRTAACRWLQRDRRSMEEVSKMLGHSQTSITEQRYAFLDLEEVAQNTAQGARS
jgi:integrase